MKIRLILASSLLSTTLWSPTAVAHPEGHDDERAIPRTCAELANPALFTDDVSYPEVKALKERCDAEKKAAPKKQAPQPTTERKSG